MFEKDNNETNEQRNKQVELIKKVEEPSNESDDSEKIIQNGNKVESVTPPKPLPRRTSSLSESEEVPMQKPVARPRTNSVITTSAPLSVPVSTPVITAASPVTTHTTVNVQTAYKVIIVSLQSMACHTDNCYAFALILFL